MLVNITQFHLPNGHRTAEQCEVSDGCADNYKAILDNGCRLTAEILRTGHVSIAIEHPESDYIIKIVPNGPGVKEAVENLIMEFDEKAFPEWLKDLLDDEE